MNRDELIKKVTAAIDAALRTGMHGTIDIEFVAGTPMFLKVLTSEKLSTGTRNRDHYEQNQR